MPLELSGRRDGRWSLRFDGRPASESGRAWINHEWLAELLLRSVYDPGGSWGLLILKLLSVAAVFGLRADHLRWCGVGGVLVGLGVVAIRSVADAAEAWGIQRARDPESSGPRLQSRS